MLKSFKKAFSGTPEQTYLNERLQSAKWLGWEAQATPANPKPSQRMQAAEETVADSLLAHPSVSSKPA